ADLAEDHRRRRVALGVDAERGEERRGVAHVHSVHVGDGLAADPEVERLGLETRAGARLAGPVRAVAREEDADVHLVSLALEPAEPAADAVELVVPLLDQPALLRLELRDRDVDGNLAPAAEGE